MIFKWLRWLSKTVCTIVSVAYSDLQEDQQYRRVPRIEIHNPISGVNILFRMPTARGFDSVWWPSAKFSFYKLPSDANRLYIVG